jgi:hypothetical protein
MTEKYRIYKTEPQEVLNSQEKVETAISQGIDWEAFTRLDMIEENKITEFCQGCDHFDGQEVPCKVVGSNDQARYANRKWCGYSRVNGVRVDKQA